MVVKISDFIEGRLHSRVLMINTGPGEGGRSRQPERIAL